MIYFTSDTHFGHRNILDFTQRPWTSLPAMENAIIERINERVGLDDVLYLLGDFALCGRDHALEIRRRIRCRRIHLIRGNHDRDWSQPEVAGTFIIEPLICVIKPDRTRQLALCHYPMMSWPGMGYGAIHLHGHIHSSASCNEATRAEGVLRYDVGVDANDCAPISLDEVLAFFADVRPRSRQDSTSGRCDQHEH